MTGIVRVPFASPGPALCQFVGEIVEIERDAMTMCVGRLIGWTWTDRVPKGCAFVLVFDGFRLALPTDAIGFVVRAYKGR